ncbi:MAG: extracellular solute-binding protein [Spirochaetes bacterium]|nr:extracellular solute-binding protein [Spirochaetota bacterium]
MRFFKVCLLLQAFFLISCNINKTAQIWTDRSEFALYGELFNAAQSQYKVAVKYAEFPVTELNKQNRPDIIVASWIKSASTSSYFKSLDGLFGTKKLSRSIFYPKILSAGRVDRSQYLLPVSFNIPAFIFAKSKGQSLSNQFTIDFDEIKKLSKEYNTMNRGVYTRMGFSPLWNDNFLLSTTLFYGASFKDANPLTWDSAALEKSMVFINNWTNEINAGPQAEDDFTFKYFFEPPEKLIQSGRILFSYMDSDDLFLLNEESKSQLDFRWAMEQGKIMVSEDLVYLGMPKKVKTKSAAKAFIIWFFSVENQRRILEYTKSYRINENIFGICGGFSVLSPVTEQIYPLFYPELLGRMPPSENFTNTNILPANWLTIKERVVMPYLNDRARKERADEAYPLERRLADWMKINR